MKKKSILYSLRKFVSKYCVLILVLIPISNAYSTTYYISNSGKDTNSGTSSLSPWKSISKLNSKYLIAGDRVLFKKGDIFNESLNVSYSGKNGSPITYGGYGEGDNPTLSGLISLSNWTLHSNGIYKCPVVIEKDVNLLLIDGKMYNVGRFPNTGYLTYEEANTNVSITDYELSSAINWTDAEVVIKKNGWTIDRNRITNHTGNTLYYESASSNNARIGTSYGYFIQRDIRTLDEFGEWFYDGTYMYVFLGTDIPDNYDIQTSNINDIIKLNQRAYIDIIGIDIEGSNKNAISANIFGTVNIKNCNIRYSGCDGITIWGGASSIDFNNNKIIDTQGQALIIGDAGTFYNIITSHNTIKNCGLNPGMGGPTSRYGGMLVRGYNSVIENNVIEECGYIGIFFMRDGSITRNNFVLRSNQILTDGGSIYTWFGSDDPNDSQNGMKMLDNIVVGSGSIGLYSDGYTNGLEISGNTVIGCNTYGVHMNQPRDNILTDNSFYGNKTASIDFTNQLTSTLNAKDNIVKNNIIFSNLSNSLYKLRDGRSQEIYNFGVSDNNYIVLKQDDIIAMESFARNLETDSWEILKESLSSWQTNYKNDQNSLITLNDKEVLIEYNASMEKKTIYLSEPMLDAKGNKYADEVALDPFSSVMLFLDPNPSVTIINHPPVITNQTINTSEVTPGGMIGSITASDIDSEQNLTYKIISGDTQTHFWLSEKSGNVYTVPTYDPSEDLSAILTVKVTDNGTPSLSDTAEIKVVHNSANLITNNAPIIVDQSLTVDQIVPGGMIGNVKASDPDNNDLTYQIVSGDVNNHFWIAPASGNLYSTPAYNIEDDISANLVIQVTDNGNPAKSASAELKIIHSISINESPIILNQTLNLTSATQGGVIGNVKATDPDNNDLEYQIVSGDVNNHFWIAPASGNLYTTQSYNGEDDISANLIIQVTDNGIPAKSASAEVIVIHNIVRNESPEISDQILHLTSVEHGGLVGNVTANDPDNNDLEYKIVSGDVNNHFWIAPASGNLYTTQTYNGIENISANLVIQVTDNGNPSKSASAEIIIQHISNNPPSIKDQSIKVTNVSAGGKIGTVIASDIDTEQFLTYKITSSEKLNMFWIAPASGNLYTVQSYNGEDDLSTKLIVEVTDNGNPEKSETAEISIIHKLNSAPVIVNQSINIKYPKAGEKIGTVVATDVDVDQNLTFSIISGENLNQFWIAPSSGNLYTSQAYNNLDNLTSSLIIKVTDNGSPVKSSSAEVQVIHSLNNPPEIPDQTLLVSEVVASGDRIGSIIASDIDSDQTLTFEIESGDLNRHFWIAPNSGNLYTLTGYNPEENLSASLKIRVTDNGTPSKSVVGDVTVIQTVTKSSSMIDDRSDSTNIEAINISQEEISIFPNPCKDNLYIEISNLEGIKRLQIINISGIVVYQKEYSSDISWIKEKLNLIDFVPGIYLIKIESKEKTISEQIMKQ